MSRTINRDDSRKVAHAVLRLATMLLLVGLAAFCNAWLRTVLARQRGDAKGAAPAAATARLNVVKTGIPVSYKGRVEVGTSVIAYGTGMMKGVDYIRPGDTKGRGIPDDEKFSSLFFAVCGDKIVLAHPQEFTLSVYDTAAGRMTDIPEDQLRLRTVSGNAHEGGGIQSSGAYAVVITDTSGADDSALKVLDLSGAEPRVIRFDGSGIRRSNQAQFKQVAIDAGSGYAAAATFDYEIKLFNFRKPDEAPRVIPLEKYKGAGAAQMRFDGGRILFQSGEAYPRAMLLDVNTGEVTELSRAVHGLALGGGAYVYFAERDSKDTFGVTARAAVGKAGAQPAYAAGEQAVDGATQNNGYLGFGSSAAVTPDGQHILIAGREDVGRTERLQVWRAGKFSPVPDASTRPAFLQASDLTAGPGLVAFKTGADNNTTLAYAVLR